MTQTPTNQLIEKWIKEICPLGTAIFNDSPFLFELHNIIHHVAVRAAEWELEACCNRIEDDAHDEWDTNDLREARRSEPSTLNSIAQAMLDTIEKDGRYLPEITDTIRKALTEASKRETPCPTRQQALTSLNAIASGANDTREQQQDLETIRDALYRLPPDA